jgi:hypothetical protein
MKTQRDSNGQIARSGTRIRESVRCLPKGHFQQIRQMFDKQILDREQKQNVLSSHVLFELPVTDDEKLQHSTNIDDILLIEENALPECQVFPSKLRNQSFQPILSLPNENHFHTGKKTFCF